MCTPAVSLTLCVYTDCEPNFVCVPSQTKSGFFTKKRVIPEFFHKKVRFKRVFVLKSKFLVFFFHIKSELSAKKVGLLLQKCTKSEFFYKRSGSFYLGSEFFT